MGGEKRKSSSHLPNSMLKTIANEERPLNSDEGDDEIDSDDGNGGDFDEYEEGVAEEESRKNNRYDRVDKYEFELPEDFEDENVESEEEEEDDDDDNRHTRMLQGLTKMPTAALQEGESKNKRLLFTEVYPECEFNPTRDVLEGKSLLTVEDFLKPLEGTPRYNQLKERITRIGQKDTKYVVHAPLPKPERERLERKVVKLKD